MKSVLRTRNHLFRVQLRNSVLIPTKYSVFEYDFLLDPDPGKIISNPDKKKSGSDLMRSTTIYLYFLGMR